MTGQEKDMCVANVVGEGKQGIDRVRKQDEGRPRARDRPQTNRTNDGEQQTEYTELLSRVEPPHADPIDELIGTDTHHHRLAPVDFRGVEPEGRKSFAP